MDLKDVLKKLRKAKNLNQKEAAKQIGLSESALNSYESGRRIPNFESMKKLEDYYQVTSSFLRGESDDNVFFLLNGNNALEAKALNDEFELFTNLILTLPQLEQITVYGALANFIKLFTRNILEQDRNYAEYVNLLLTLSSQLNGHNKMMKQSPNLIDKKLYPNAIKTSIIEISELYETEYLSQMESKKKKLS